MKMLFHLLVSYINTEKHWKEMNTAKHSLLYQSTFAVVYVTVDHMEILYVMAHTQENVQHS